MFHFIRKHYKHVLEFSDIEDTDSEEDSSDEEREEIIIIDETPLGWW